MAINLTKGQRIEIGLSKVGVGLGWKPNEETGFDFDLDASAFMLGVNKKLPKDEFFVFYNNLCGRGHRAYTDSTGDHNECAEKYHCTDGLFGVRSLGDDTTGGSSDGDDETLTLDLAKVPSEITEIVFTVTIHDYETRRQTFGQVHKSFIRIYNAQTNEEILKYELDEDFSVEAAVEFGRLYKRNGEWKFEAIGDGYPTKKERDNGYNGPGGLQYFVNKYA
ncbi:chemical-damaging agent resistance protein C [Bacteroidia bacterium]|nr:chemical-damaging agent resistance protein C [Bacteroidia bacterium]